MLVGIHNKDVIHGFFSSARVSAQVADRFVNRHIRAQARITRVHQSAGLVLRVDKQALDFPSHRLIEQQQKIFAFIAGSFLDQVGSIIGSQHAHPQALLAGRQTQQELRAIAGAELKKKIVRCLSLQKLKCVDPFFKRQHGPSVVKLGRRKIFLFHEFSFSRTVKCDRFTYVTHRPGRAKISAV